MTTITRDDPRYTTQGDPRAILIAWAGADESCLCMDMGGWKGDDEDEFREAIRDELRHGAGDDSALIVIRTKH